MSSIEKLSIRGIRSFSPHREEIIEFYHPLTVILGDNGSGKTTIIECLKISCTGSLPPGARSGQSFVHDPRIAGTNEVKASVRLRFRNRAGKPMVVQRTFQLQQQMSNAKFKALDGVIRVKNELGENVSMSHKCAELDRHIPDMLGVSKAILESVIFCHQEESNWPLLEGAALKKRFDDIFESARYTKALEAIRKLKKARNENAKDFSRDLTVLNVKLKTVQDIREKMEAAEEKILLAAEDASRLDSNIEQAEETLEEMEQLQAEIKAKHDVLDRLQNDAIQKEQAIHSAYQKIEKMMSDSDEHLEALLSNHDSIIDDQNRAFKSLKEEESQLEREQSTSREKYNKLCTEKAILESKIEAHQNLVKELLDHASRAGTKYQFHPQPLASQDDDIRSFLNKFRFYVSEKTKAFENVEEQNRIGSESLNTELRELHAKLTLTSTQLKSKQEERGNLNSEKRAHAAKMKMLSSKPIPSAREIAEAEKLAEEAEKALQAFKEQNKYLSLKSDIDDLSKHINDANFEISRDNEIIKVLRTSETKYIALEAKRQAISDKEDDFRDRLAEKATEYRSLLDGQEPGDEQSFVATMERLNEILTRRKEALEEKTRQARSADQKLQENIAASTHIEKTLEKLRSEKTELERGPVGQLKKSIEEISPGGQLRNAEAVVQMAEKTYFAAKDKTLRSKNTIRFLTIFKEKGIKDKCCPLCVRDMGPEDEELFIKTMNEKTDDQKVKDTIKKAETAEGIALKKWKEAEANLPSWRSWKRLEGQVKEKSSELDSLFASQQILQADVTAQKSSAEHANELVEEADEACRAFASLRSIISELQKLRSKVADEEESLRTDDAEVLGANAPTLADVQTARDEKQAKLQEFHRQLQLKQAESQRIQDMQQQLQNNLYKKKDEKMRLDKLRQQYDEAIEEQGKLREREKSLVDEITGLTHLKPDAERALAAKHEEFQTYQSGGLKKLQQDRLEEQQCKQELQSFQEKWTKIEDQGSEKLDAELKRFGEQIAQIKQKEISATHALEEISPQIATARDSLAEKEVFKRHIRDNLDYRHLKMDFEVLRVQVDETKRKISALPALEDVSRRVRVASATVSSTKEERATLRGRQQQLDLQVREEKVKLKSAEYRNVEEKHRQKLIQYETTMMAVSDLDKYFKALDQSLLQFHSKKVEEINSIIKSLWQITYKGQDIDTIEVVSGQDSETGTVRAARSYDYRVVMKKGGALIDMRGRCSAGQKVLAALVIRLALAETFCLNCGILALDEPTTNLDTENKLGLAQAITDILNARSAQQNFQLVCITHDEEFVRMLSEAQSMDGSRPEYYWRISREDIGNNRFCSKIERREWRDGI